MIPMIDHQVLINYHKLFELELKEDNNDFKWLKEKLKRFPEL